MNWSTMDHFNEELNEIDEELNNQESDENEASYRFRV